MDDQRRDERRDLGAQAIGALHGLLMVGALNNYPRNAELAKDLCDRWDAASEPTTTEGA